MQLTVLDESSCRCLSSQLVKYAHTSQCVFHSLNFIRNSISKVFSQVLIIVVACHHRFSKLAARHTRTHIETMQFSDFFNVGGGLADTVKIVLFRMLPRGAQIQKVRAEIDNGLLKKYGKLTGLEIDKENRIISADFELKGEKEGVRIKFSNYRLIQEDGKNPVFEPGTIDVSREWLNALLKTLVKTSVIPERMEVKNLLHQTVVKSIL